MPLDSSPPLYPQSSSPPEIFEKRKGSFLDASPVKFKRRFFGLKEAENVVCTNLKESVANIACQPSTTDKAELKRTGPFFEDDNDTADDPTIFAIIQDISQRPTASLVPNLLSSKGTLPKPQDPKDNGAIHARTATGRSFNLRKRSSKAAVSGESVSEPSEIMCNEKKAVYGVEINDLIGKALSEPVPNIISIRTPDDEIPRPSIETPSSEKGNMNRRTMMWTEKYRAKKFTDLVGDERTHRQVLRWLKGWDPTVFPASQKSRPKSKPKAEMEDDPIHRKILLLTGPPGLGKTTLAHVCARQAGYEVVEINASDERNRDVVKGRIRDCVGTENVKGVNVKSSGGTVRKAGRPVCVIVDEVDGVVSGSGSSGEGGFIKALIDLVTLDQKNSTSLGQSTGNVIHSKRGKRGDRFRFLRPLILICNDVYHPTLRPLRSSSIAEIIHIRRPPLDKVVARLKTVFEKEGVACDGDGVRRLCEAAWGISDKRDTRLNSSSTGGGDIRGVLVVGEWAAAQIRANTASFSQNSSRLTKKWVEQHILQGLSYGGAAARGLSRGGVKEALERVFIDGAGFPKSAGSKSNEGPSKSLIGQPLGISEPGKRSAMVRLREMVDTCGESDRIVADCFASYPSQPIQDDIFLSKPNAVYDWLYFHDSLSSKVYSGQEWELSPYLSQTALSFHNIFASPPKYTWLSAQKQWDDDIEKERVPFSGLRADYEASEAQKANRAILVALQSSLSALLIRNFRSPQDISVEFLPYLTKMLAPDIKPVVMGGSGDQKSVVNVRNGYEREMLKRAAGVMVAVGVKYERVRIEDKQIHSSNYVYRMEPPLDILTNFDTSAKNPTTVPSRYAVYQALDQEYQKYLIRQCADNRQLRYHAGDVSGHEATNIASGSIPDSGEMALKPKTIKRDFFGRIIDGDSAHLRNENVSDGTTLTMNLCVDSKMDRKVWVSFHEGFSNAVRKPITLEELMKWF